MNGRNGMNEGTARQRAKQSLNRNRRDMKKKIIDSFDKCAKE